MTSTTITLDPTVNPEPNQELKLNLWCMLESWKKILLGFIEEGDDTTFVHLLTYACDQIMDGSKANSEKIHDSWEALRAICNFARRKRAYLDQPTKLPGSHLECGIFRVDAGEGPLVSLYWDEADSNGLGAFVAWRYYSRTKQATVKWRASQQYPCERIAELICWDGPASVAAAE
jgi:hypothetical protein